MTPALFIENYFNERAFTEHGISANVNTEDAFRVGTNRRSLLDALEGETNTILQVDVDCGEVKPVDYLAVDRGANIFGKAIKLRGSTDDFAASNDILLDITLPAASPASSGALLTAGAITKEGAWVREISEQTYRYYRFEVAAVADFTPKVVNLSLGPLWKLPFLPDRPHNEDEENVQLSSIETPAGWRGPGQISNRKEGSVGIRLENFDAYADALTFQEHWNSGRVAWYIPDQAKAEKAFKIVTPGGRSGFFLPESEEWAYRVQRLQYIEHEPKTF